MVFLPMIGDSSGRGEPLMEETPVRTRMPIHEDVP